MYLYNMYALLINDDDDDDGLKILRLHFVKIQYDE